MKRKPSVTTQTVVDAIYDAALEPEGWEPCLAAIRDQFACPTAIFFVEDTENKRATFSLMEGLDKKGTLAYYSYYIFKDPNLRAKLSLPVGTVTASNLLMRDAEWENEEFYWDFARKGNVFYQLGGVIVREQGVVGAVGLHRPKRAGGFARRDIRQLERIIGHVQRAYHISRTLASFNATLAQLLDQSPQAVFLLDASSRPLMVNRAAERMLREGDGIALENGRLSCRPVPGWQRFARYIHDAIQTGQGRSIHPGGAMAVGRPSGRTAYQVLVTPLRVPPTLLPGRPATACAAVYITDPEAHPPPPAAALAAWFNLTPAEARVARELADGHSPEEIAQAHHVSRGTIRVQMHAIFDKMDVKRQSQLVKKILGLPHGWPEGGTRNA